MPEENICNPNDDFDPDFHPDDFDEVAPDVDFTNPAPVSETEMVPPPIQPVTASRMPVPRARRLLAAEVEVIKTAIADLKNLEMGQKVLLGECAIDALVSATCDSQLPLTEDNRVIDRRRNLAAKGELNTHISLGLDELEDTLATLEAGRAALKAISLRVQAGN